jgi:predicted glycosyl hydrolase (DUF1957 family)
VAVDDFCLPKDYRGVSKGGFVYSLGNQFPKLLARDRALTDLISFKRDSDRSHIVTEILKNSNDKLIALDAETFGHHNKDGLYLFESIISDVTSKGVEVATLSEVVQQAEVVSIPHIEESTWSSSEDAVYPLWVNEGSRINTALWSLQKEVSAEFVSKYLLESPTPSSSQKGGLPIWKFEYDARVSSLDLQTRVALGMLRLQQSDQFWWSTEAEVMGKRNFSKYMIDSVLDYYVDVVKDLGSNKLLVDRIEELRNLMKD